MQSFNLLNKCLDAKMLPLLIEHDVISLDASLIVLVVFQTSSHGKYELNILCFYLVALVQSSLLGWDHTCHLSTTAA